MNYRVVKEVDDINDFIRHVYFLRDSLGKEFTHGEYLRGRGGQTVKPDANLAKGYYHIRGSEFTKLLTVESLITVYRAKNWWAGRLLYTDVATRKVHKEFAFMTHDEFVALQLKLMIE